MWKNVNKNEMESKDRRVSDRLTLLAHGMTNELEGIVCTAGDMEFVAGRVKQAARVPK